jgi:hypothetical protein
MRKLAPGALELVYDNYNALAIGFSPTERAGDGNILNRTLSAARESFLPPGRQAARPDPPTSGSRHVVLKDLALLDAPDVRSLIAMALETAKVPLDATQERRMIIKSISARQRPRRPKGR